MSDDDFRLLIEHGDTHGMRRALEADAGLANRTIRWYLNQPNESDPLHFVSDCVSHGWLKNGTEGQIAELLLEFGAELNGTLDRESPLIASTSLGAERVSKVLIEAGAEHIRSWRGRRVSQVLEPPIGHTDEVIGLLQAAGGTAGNLVTDAQIAAFAQAYRAAVHTADRDFLRFPDIRCYFPLN